MKIIFYTILSTMLVSATVPRNYKKYFEKHLETARFLEEAVGVPVSIQFAQAVYESGCGRSNIAKQANNHFGIRCGSTWQYEEFYTASGCWRKYYDVGQGYIDHAYVLLDLYPHMMCKPYNEWETLEGYGEPNYWRKICKIVERYKLDRLDNLHK